mgnify:CR=1 FL=1|jgi:hypothetical protein
MSIPNLKQTQALILKKSIVCDLVEFSWMEIKGILEKLQNNRMLELTVNGIHKDNWSDDEQIREIEEDIYFVHNMIQSTEYDCREF